ncbi:MAG: type I methionyl aminopeptidase [Fusobacteriaceae bacterium]|nr:type I methionyl aminopeptidase [Fusobacteriaceae bacterium]
MALIKTLEEIKKIKKANQIIAKLYREILPPHVKAGVTTGEINAIADDFIRAQGARPACIGVPGPLAPFPAACCISVNDEVIHGIPGGRKLHAGDLVSIDICTELDGYYGDAAYTFPVGEATPEDARLLAVTREALESGIQAAVVGARIGDISHTVQRCVERQGFSVVRDYAGHGVGHDIHEDPIIPNYGRAARGIKIENGMVLAIEPMVNVGSYKVVLLADGWTVSTKDGKKSAHFEHTIAIVDGKALILSEAE